MFLLADFNNLWDLDIWINCSDWALLLWLSLFCINPGLPLHSCPGFYKINTHPLSISLPSLPSTPWQHRITHGCPTDIVILSLWCHCPTSQQLLLWCYYSLLKTRVKSTQVNITPKSLQRAWLWSMRQNLVWSCWPEGKEPCGSFCLPELELWDWEVRMVLLG